MLLPPGSLLLKTQACALRSPGTSVSSYWVQLLHSTSILLKTNAFSLSLPGTQLVGGYSFIIFCTKERVGGASGRLGLCSRMNQGGSQLKPAQRSTCVPGDLKTSLPSSSLPSVSASPETPPPTSLGLVPPHLSVFPPNSFLASLFLILQTHFALWDIWCYLAQQDLSCHPAPVISTSCSEVPS